MSNGWIYLRKNVNLNGDVMAYCIGKTGNEKKRRKTYRKENPFIEHVEDYKATNMHAAETMLRDFIKDNNMQLVGRSSEWLRKECFEQFYEKWLEVKSEWWVNKPEKPKRKYLQPLGFGAVKPLPPVGKPRPLNNWKKKEDLIAYAQEATGTPLIAPKKNITTQSIAAVDKSILDFAAGGIYVASLLGAMMFFGGLFAIAIIAGFSLVTVCLVWFLRFIGVYD